MYSIFPETLINRDKRYRKIDLCIKEGCLGSKKSLSYEIPKKIITDKNWTQANFEKRVCQRESELSTRKRKDDFEIFPGNFF